MPPLARNFKLGAIGLDVEAVRRALWRAGYLKHQKGTAFSTFAGPLLIAALKRFQRDRHLAPDGVYGAATHKQLVPRGFDELADELMSREAVRQTAIRLLAFAPLPYSQGRPIDLIARSRRTVQNGVYVPLRPARQDCSGEAIGSYWVPGLSQLLGDENAHGDGNTWSLARHGKQVSLGQLQPGDLVFYDTEGPGSLSHVGVYVGNLGLFRRDVVVGTLDVIDDGHDGGPFVNPVNKAPINQCRSYL